MTRQLTTEQLAALQPLAAAIENAIRETPIRLGTDDWGTMLAARILADVSVFMGRVVSVPEHAAGAEQLLTLAASADDEQPFPGRRRVKGGRLVHATRLEARNGRGAQIAACGVRAEAAMPEIRNTPVTCKDCKKTLARLAADAEAGEGQ